MQERHMDQDVEQRGGEQHTGNHRKPQAGGGADKVGGTRSGASNIEAPVVTNIEKGTDVDRVASLDSGLDESVSVQGPVERAPERDERGRL
jgi:hypothetical protein